MSSNLPGRTLNFRNHQVVSRNEGKSVADKNSDKIKARIESNYGCAFFPQKCSSTLSPFGAEVTKVKQVDLDKLPIE